MHEIKIKLSDRTFNSLLKIAKKDDDNIGDIIKKSLLLYYKLHDVNEIFVSVNEDDPLMEVKIK